MQSLLEYIKVNGLTSGDRLPAERELAAQLGVSRNSLKQAFVVLEVQGLVDIRQGDGTYLRRIDVQVEPVEVLLDRKQRLPDILDAREAIETKLAELAAVRRTNEDLQAMAAALEAMHASTSAGDLGVEGDRQFHAAMAAAGHSRILQDMYAALAPSISEARQESLRQPGRPQQSLEQHQQILEAIRKGDGAQAAEAVRHHVSTVSAVRLLHWQP